MTYHDKARLSGIELKGEGEGDGDDPSAIVTKALDELRATVDERLKPFETKAADTEKLTKRLDAIEVKLNRPGTGSGDRPDEQAAAEQKAFVGFLRRGKESLGADEVKSFRVSDDTSGGYLAPAQFSAEVDKNIVQFSPIRQAARVGSTASGSVPRASTPG